MSSVPTQFTNFRWATPGRPVSGSTAPDWFLKALCNRSITDRDFRSFLGLYAPPCTHARRAQTLGEERIANVDEFHIDMQSGAGRQRTRARRNQVRAARLHPQYAHSWHLLDYWPVFERAEARHA